MTHYKNTDHALSLLAERTLKHGAEVGSRLGERTMELLHEHIVLEQPWQREVLTPRRNVNIAAQIAETMWVLAGRNDVEWLSHYLPRAADFSDDGKVWRGGYGPRLRAWVTDESQFHVGGSASGTIDQIAHVVDLLTGDRSSRRAVVSIYDPGVDIYPGKDIPCNDFLSFISREGRLDLSVFVRSNDLIWGWSGINQFEWSALQEIVAGLLGLEVGVLVFNTTSLHIYDRHWSKARQIAEHGQSVFEDYLDSPRFSTQNVHTLDALDRIIKSWFAIEERARTGENVAVPIDAFPEPMLRSWLRIIAWYWSGDEDYLSPLEGTRLHRVVQEMPRGILSQVIARREPGWTGAEAADNLKAALAPLAHKPAFIEYVDNLHREKSAAYGDSWKKRGEQMSILANIARKIDRLESGKSTEDEVIADTAIDLLVYLIKYRLWLSEQHPSLAQYVTIDYSGEMSEDAKVRATLNWLGTVTVLEPSPSITSTYPRRLVNDFERLESLAATDPHRKHPENRVEIVARMITEAFPLARRLWEDENKVGPLTKAAARNATRRWNPDA